MSENKPYNTNNTNRADIDIARGLMARLELDASLGAGYVAAGDEVAALLRGFAEPGRGSPAQARSLPERTDVPRRAESAPAVPAVPVVAAESPERRRVGATTRILGDTHPTLVAIPQVAANPAREAALAGLRAECMECTACELCAKRTTVVWGEGSLSARVMFIGEGPGRDEDREGRPFVGRSGRLLTDIIEKGMKVSRGDVYIANVVKCRPPGNRDPKPEEVAACSRYLREQIRVIGPGVIVAVGGVAGCALLGLEPRTPGLRGRWHDYGGIPLRVIYHPSYLLRQRRFENDRTKADRETWGDILEVMERVGMGRGS